jgi:Avidin family
MNMLKSKNELKLFSGQTKEQLELEGTWINELGSTMTIERYADGKFSGWYASKVSEGEEPVRGRLTGMIAGDTIGFVVNWLPKFNSITSWSGKVLATEQGAPYIYTLWYLSRGVENPSDWWQSFLAGSDTFWKQQHA